jgi:hypothetical protein
LVADVTARMFFFSVDAFFPKRPLMRSCQDVTLADGWEVRTDVAAIEATVACLGAGVLVFGGSLTTGFGVGR